MKKAVSHVLLVCLILSVFSFSAFAAGSSTTPSYPTSTYSYVTGLSSSNTPSTRSASYFDAVTGSLVGLGSALGSLNGTLGSIKSNTNSLSSLLTDIKGHTGMLRNTDTTVSLISSRIGDISTVVSWMKNNWPSGGGSGSSAWTSTQASNVHANVALIEAYSKSTSGNVAQSNTWLEMISDKVATESTLSLIKDKVATEATLQTLATESTLFDFKQHTVRPLAAVLTYVKSIASVVASDNDRLIKESTSDQESWVKDYFSGSGDKADSSKYDNLNNTGSAFKDAFKGAPDTSIADGFTAVNDNGYDFWSQAVSDDINGSSSVATFSADPSQQIVDAYSENWEQIVGGYYD